MKERIKAFLSQYGYAVILSLVVLAINVFIYYVTPLIGKNFKIWNLSIKGFDDKVPLVRIFFIPYFLSYPFWLIVPIIAGKNKARLCNWFIAVLMGFAVVALIYCFMPTTIARPVDEMLASESAIDRLIGEFYLLDGGYQPFCCFPSLHCFLSAFCYISVRRQKNIHVSVRIVTLIMTLLIYLATQFTKQHYIVDMISSVVLAELAFFICNKFNLGKGLLALIEKIENRMKKNEEQA